MISPYFLLSLNITCVPTVQIAIVLLIIHDTIYLLSHNRNWVAVWFQESISVSVSGKLWSIPSAGPTCSTIVNTGGLLKIVVVKSKGTIICVQITGLIYWYNTVYVWWWKLVINCSWTGKKLAMKQPREIWWKRYNFIIG